MRVNVLHVRSLDILKKCVNNMCPHGEVMIYCKVCNAGPICIHSNIKTLCNICVNAERCEHNRRKMRCTICLKR
ncbi:hypothetical protein MpV1_014c [Micromonas sp. RCC1109 virus MpV1]|uniref:hypothetical protein n=1 Tax=Micromonas sp. RCC1109 virus MpV1 TaxID=880161 RepID=UPI0001EF442A|nr:hypothetical protein MpV1_014c [Micromonas sp. RCC1109 virus MpV1]ADQ90937.1 hypothetical protein MpV1_014c [Micromonas sp. RCC1109 virus MpV1]